MSGKDQYLVDARILGGWIPLYLGYRAAEKSGLIGWWIRSSPNQYSAHDSSVAPPLKTADLAELVPHNEEEVLQIQQGNVGLFGGSVALGDPPLWHTVGTRRWEASSPCWRIDLYEDERSDVKWVWELGRHRHLVVVARALLDRPDDTEAKRLLNAQLKSWFEVSSAGLGVHWYSNLEIALRSIAWVQILGMARAHLQTDVEQALLKNLHLSGRHIAARLPLTLSTMRNNHLIGEAVGLIAIGRMFPADRGARRWTRIGDALLKWHLPRHVHNDGSTIEDSLDYRCFVLELLSLRTLLGDPPEQVSNAAFRLAAHLGRTGVGASDDIPHFGDWDAGHVFAGCMPDLDPNRSVNIYRAVSETRSTSTSARTDDQMPSPTAVIDGSDTGGSLGRLNIGPWTAWLKCTAEESHGHSDLLSVSIRHHGNWVVGDPGNGSYNRSMEERNYFRTAIAHSVVRVEGEDQRVPHRRFRWRYQPSGELGQPFDAGPFRVMWGTHDAYRRLKRPQDCMRACLVDNTTFIVIDWVIGEPTDYSMSLPLHPDVQWDGEQVQLADGTTIGIALPRRVTSVRGSHEPYDGWWADTYDSVRPATRLEITGTTDQAIIWALFTEAEPSYEVKRDEVSVGNVTFKPERRDDRLVLLSD